MEFKILFSLQPEDRRSGKRIEEAICELEEQLSRQSGPKDLAHWLVEVIRSVPGHENVEYAPEVGKERMVWICLAELQQAYGFNNPADFLNPADLKASIRQALNAIGFQFIVHIEAPSAKL